MTLIARQAKKHLVRYLNAKDFFSPYQFGFRPRRSTELQLLYVLNNWTSCLDEGHNIDVLYIDFKKAFDLIPHSSLLSKLKSVGVGGGLLKWFGAYLTRTQQVVVNDSKSDTTIITSGVPQGSLLGPILFLIYVNDLPQAALDAHCVMYADDTKIYQVVDNEADSVRFQSVIDEVCVWCSRWGMKLNVLKTNVMHLGKSNPCLPYFALGTKLDRVDMTKDLGVTISSDLSVRKHVKNVCGIANYRIKLLKSCFTNTDIKFLLSLYKTYILPLFTYCCTVWYPQYQCEWNMLERVQRDALAYIYRGVNYHQALKMSNLLTIQKLFQVYDLVMVFKIYNNLVDANLNDFFTLSQMVTTRVTLVKFLNQDVDLT